MESPTIFMSGEKPAATTVTPQVEGSKAESPWRPGPIGYLQLIEAVKPLEAQSDVPEDLMICDSTGTMHNITQLATNQTVVIFIIPGNGEGTQFGEPGMWGCTPESCSFNNAYSSFEEKGIKVFGMSLQSAETQNAFITDKNLAFPILTDTDRKLINSIGINIYQVIDDHERAGEQFAQRTTIIMNNKKITYIERDVLISHSNAEEDAINHVTAIKNQLDMNAP